MRSLWQDGSLASPVVHFRRTFVRFVTAEHWLYGEWSNVALSVPRILRLLSVLLMLMLLLLLLLMLLLLLLLLLVQVLANTPVELRIVGGVV